MRRVVIQQNSLSVYDNIYAPSGLSTRVGNYW